MVSIRDSIILVYVAINIVGKTQRRTTKDRTQGAYVFKERSLKEKSLQIRPRRNRDGKTMVLIFKEKEVIQRCHMPQGAPYYYWESSGPSMIS